MADKCEDFYAVLELPKECTVAELRNAYKRLAMKWHPDRCYASSDSKYIEESKRKFQAVQEAYSVLSDANRRFLYDLGVYDCDDHDDENGMGDFLNEMASMMSHKSNENASESFEELKSVFNKMIESDIESFNPSSAAPPSTTYSSVHPSYSETYQLSAKRNSSDMSANYSKAESFCIGVALEEIHSLERGSRERIDRRVEDRRNGRKQKISYGQDVTSNYNSSIDT